MKRLQLTEEDVQNMRRALEDCWRREREAIQRKIQDGQAVGDTYHDEGFKQASQEEGQFAQQAARIQGTLDLAEVVIPQEQDQEIALGSGVKLEFSDGIVSRFIIVECAIGHEENVISANSPLGEALIGAKKGRKKIYHAGGEKKSVKIVAIFPPSNAKVMCGNKT